MQDGAAGDALWDETSARPNYRGHARKARRRFQAAAFHHLMCPTRRALSILSTLFRTARLIQDQPFKTLHPSKQSILQNNPFFKSTPCQQQGVIMEESPCGIAAIVVRSLIPAADGPVRTEEGVRPSGETARAWVGSVERSGLLSITAVVLMPPHPRSIGPCCCTQGDSVDLAPGSSSEESSTPISNVRSQPSALPLERRVAASPVWLGAELSRARPELIKKRTISLPPGMHDDVMRAVHAQAISPRLEEDAGGADLRNSDLKHSVLLSIHCQSAKSTSSCQHLRIPVSAGMDGTVLKSRRFAPLNYSF